MPTDIESASESEESTTFSNYVGTRTSRSRRAVDDGKSGLSSQHQCVEPSSQSVSQSFSQNQSLYEDIINRCQTHSFAVIPETPLFDLDLCVVNVDHQRFVSTYAREIFAYLKEREQDMAPNPELFTTVQLDIKPWMRSVLVEWLAEVTSEYQCTNDTLFLAVSFLDRVLSKRPVFRERLQLLGATCLFIASKLEEVDALTLSDFIFVCAETYSKQEFLEMERLVLNTLEFTLHVPTAKSFIRRFCRAAHGSSTMFLLAYYLLELTLLSNELLAFPPSKRAASCVFLAKYNLNPTEDVDSVWTHDLRHYTTYTLEKLKPVIKILWELWADMPNDKLSVIYKHYSSRDLYRGVARIPVSPYPL
ncbi:hypothetical protein PCE1_004016 [Barthelona sp. PCE]